MARAELCAVRRDGARRPGFELGLAAGEAVCLPFPFSVGPVLVGLDSVLAKDKSPDHTTWSLLRAAAWGRSPSPKRTKKRKRSSSSSSETSTSSSSTSPAPQSPASPVPTDSGNGEVWFAVSNAMMVHKVASTNEAGRFIARCRSDPFSSRVTTKFSGSPSQFGYKECPKCTR